MVKKRSHGRLSESVSTLSSSLSLAEWAYRLMTLLVIGGGGTITGAIAKADPVLNSLGAIYWVGVGLCTSVILALIFALVKSGILRQAQADLALTLATPRNGVNPLADTFADMVIPIEDLRLPGTQIHKNKHFKRCIFVGPAALAFLSGRYENTTFSECGDVVTVQPNILITGVVALQDCTVDQCQFVRVTILTDEVTASKMREFGLSSTPRKPPSDPRSYSQATL